MTLSEMILISKRGSFLANNGSILSSVRLRLDSQLTMANPGLFYLLLVLHVPGIRRGRVHMKGLVLKPTNKCKGEYERIGHFRKNGSPRSKRPEIFKKTGKVDSAKLHYTKLDRELLFESGEGEKGSHIVTTV